MIYLALALAFSALALTGILFLVWNGDRLEKRVRELEERDENKLVRPK